MYLSDDLLSELKVVQNKPGYSNGGPPEDPH